MPLFEVLFLLLDGLPHVRRRHHRLVGVVVRGLELGHRLIPVGRLPCQGLLLLLLVLLVLWLWLWLLLQLLLWLLLLLLGWLELEGWLLLVLKLLGTLLLLLLLLLELRRPLRLLWLLLSPLLPLLHVQGLLSLLARMHHHVRRHLRTRGCKLRHRHRLVGMELRGKRQGRLRARTGCLL
jgi:hypothetical protein